MATVVRRGEFLSVRFSDHLGKRRWLAAGTKSEPRAATLAGRVDSLVALRKLGQTPEGELRLWLARADADLVARLIELDLIDPEHSGRQNRLTLGQLVDRFKAAQVELAGSSRTHYGHTWANLIDHFGKDRPVDAITEGDAEGFAAWLRTKALRKKTADAPPAGLSTNTARKRLSNCKLLFRFAIRHRWLAANPFAEQRGTVRGNADRQRFIDAADVAKIIEAAPSAEWRAIIALCRWGGLRCPSELAGLRWSHIDWVGQTVLIHSPKTRRHDGKATRTIPLFPELRPLLEDLATLAQPGIESPVDALVCPRCADPTVNLRSEFQRIIERAKVTPWPRLFHNLRATRQTELAQRFPLHVVCAWIGNSAAIAQEHYLQVTAADFEAAATGSALPLALPVGRGNGLQPDAGQQKTLRNRAMDCNEMQGDGRYLTRTSDLHDVNQLRFSAFFSQKPVIQRHSTRFAGCCKLSH